MDSTQQTPQFKGYRGPGAARFEDARTQLYTGFQQYDLALDSAGDSLLQIAGDFFYVDTDPTASNGVATMQLNSSQDAATAKFFIQAGFGISQTFKQVRITWAAQPGKKMRILYATGDRVVPANTASVQILNTVPMQEQGYSYGASYKSTTNMAANTPDNVWSAASNVNGAVIWAGYGVTVNGAGANSYSLLCKATAPANITDGDVIASPNSGWAIAGTFCAFLSVLRAARISAGKRGDFIAQVAETNGQRTLLYTLL